MRTPKPWYRKQTGSWYVEIEGRQHNLGPDKDAALEKYHSLMLGRQPVGANTPVVALLDTYLDWCQKNRAVGTYEQHKRHLQSFATHVGGRLKVSQVKPSHVTSWMARSFAGLSGNYRHLAIRALQRAFNWAAAERHIDRSPLSGIEKPTPTSRDTYLEPEQWEELISVVRKGRKSEGFLDLLLFMRNTGCRPLEAREAEARHFDRRSKCIVFERELSKGQLDRRVVPLNDTALSIVQRLAAKHPTGKLFRSSLGNPWTRYALNCRFRALRAKLDFHLSAYTIRHAFATDAIERGVDVITIATIMGHRDLKMCNTSAV